MQYFSDVYRKEKIIHNGHILKDIEYEEIGWFKGKTIKTRKQTYSEFIIEKFENFLNK